MRPLVATIVAASMLVTAIGVCLAVHFTFTPSTGTGEPEQARRTGFALTTLDLPSTRDLARELLDEEFFGAGSDEGSIEPEDGGLD